jgi:DNA-binding winged helix-turn-helix (wHTH) protein
VAGPVVEENNLPAQIAVLRKVFGADRASHPDGGRRGYQFIGEIRITAATSAGPFRLAEDNLPEAVSELIGRSRARRSRGLVAEHRLVSLVGAAASARRDWP